MNWKTEWNAIAGRIAGHVEATTVFLRGLRVLNSDGYGVKLKQFLPAVRTTSPAQQDEGPHQAAKRAQPSKTALYIRRAGVSALLIGAAVACFFLEVAEASAVLTAVATVILALFTWTLSDATAAMQRTTTDTLAHLNREFAAEHRPWLMVTPKISGDLRWPVEGHGNQGLLYFDIAVHNTGRSPALHVMAGVRINPVHSSFGDVIANQALLALQLRSRDPALTDAGRTVFPNETKVLRVFAPITPETARAWRTWLAETIPVQPAPFTDAHVFGCIDYQAPDGTPHQTGFVREMHRLHNGAPWALDPRIGGDIPASDLLLSETVIGDGITT